MPFKDLKKAFHLADSTFEALRFFGAGASEKVVKEAERLLGRACLRCIESSSPDTVMAERHTYYCDGW